jgi:nucleoside-diphosphate-sugar epimerase
MSSRKTVLITGANGFIGRSVVAQLESAGWVVTKGIRSSQKILGEGFIGLDLNDPNSLLSLNNKVGFNAIVHLGAHVGWNDNISEAEMYMPNVLATGLLAMLAAKWNSFFIFSSAALVCGARNECINIDSSINPNTPYAKSKYLGEELILASNVNACILRIAGTFGYMGPSHLGLNQAIASAISGVSPTQINLGETLRNYIYVEDVSQTIVYVLEHQIQGIHFLAGSEVLSVAQMLGEVCDVFLPGQHPVAKNGPESFNQIIESSALLPRSRSFYDALVDIKCIAK